jgi:predicted nucleic acid-binding protein
MPAASNSVASNTSPLLNLAIIGELWLARHQYQTILIPPAVRDELQIDQERPGSSALRSALDEGWLQVRDVNNAPLVQTLHQSLDRGESEAIALAIQVKAKRLLLDEREARKRARALDLSITGVIGILLKGYEDGHLDSMKGAIHRLRGEAGFWIAPDLEQRILRET